MKKEILNATDVLRGLSSTTIEKYKDLEVYAKYATAFGYFEGAVGIAIRELPTKAQQQMLEALVKTTERVKSYT